MAALKKIILPLVIILIGIALIVVIFMMKPRPVPNQNPSLGPQLTKVSVKPAIRESVNLRVHSQGSVHPKRQIDLVAQVSGKIINSTENFVDGTFFKKDEPLILIDPRDYEAALIRAKAEYAQAERALAEEQGRSRQARREWRDLGDKQSNDLFLRKPQLAEAQATLSSALANLKTAELNLERTKISAPFNGRLLETHVDIGQFVSMGTPIATVYDTAIAEVRLPLSDQQLAKLQLNLHGNEETTETQPLVILRGVVAGEPHEWQGRITRTEASIDLDTRMHYAIAEVTNAFSAENSAPLIPGLYVRAEIYGRTIDSAIQLPIESLIKRQFIYTLGEENKIQLTKVKVLRKSVDTVWIESDVPSTTLIALDKQALLSVGMTVEPEHGLGDKSLAVESENSQLNSDETQGTTQ